MHPDVLWSTYFLIQGEVSKPIFISICRCSPLQMSFKYPDTAVWLFLLLELWLLLLATQIVTGSNRRDLPKAFHSKIKTSFFSLETHGFKTKMVINEKCDDIPPTPTSFVHKSNDGGYEWGVSGMVSGEEETVTTGEISLSQSLCRQEHCRNSSCTQWEIGALREGRWNSTR